MSDTQQALFWLQLAVARLHPKSAWALYQANIDSLSAVLQCTPTECAQFGMSGKEYGKLQTVWSPQAISSSQAAVDTALNWLNASERHHLLYPSHPHYPSQLRETIGAPYLLYVHGDARLLTTPQLAIVGARTPSPTGTEDARRFARTLADAGITITSGMAYGIDTAAHTGALHTGNTIAVLGTGVDTVYPASNRDLAHRIAEQGALVSEFALGSRPMAHHFPQRNRIISALSMGVFVIEAGVKSGSLITARLALEQNKDVFALPGSIHNPMTRGCHHLLKQGAILVESVADIYEHIQYQPSQIQCVLPDSSELDTSSALLNVSAEQQKILAAIDTNPVGLDTLVSRTNMSVAELAPMLFELEMMNVIRREQDNYVKYT